MKASHYFVFASLSLAGCLDSPPSGSHMQPAPGVECAEVGATDDDGCDSCTCTEEGWACTPRDCADQDQCVAGETKDAEDGCNSCTCLEDGTWACTDVACPDPAEGCTAGDTKDAGDGCNTCSCADDGSWACTEKACLPPEGCTAGDTKDADDGCNTCGCQDDGSWACTQIACGEPSDECPEPTDLPSDMVCAAVIAFGRSGETGACCMFPTPCQVPEGWTTFYDLEECEGASACEPGATKDDGCNTCSCTEDGQWLCTLIACEEPTGCGGWLGDTCSEDEYCAYEEGQHCGAADASATCEPRPEGCTKESAPVCGCDGNTYGNACMAAAAGTGVLSSGDCDSQTAG